MPRAAGIDVPVSEQPGFLKRLREMLGVARLKSDRDLLTLVEQRLPTQAIDSLRHSGLT